MRRRPRSLSLLLALLLLGAVGCSSPEPSAATGEEDPETAVPVAGKAAGGAAEEPEGVELTQTFTDPQTGLSLGVPDQWTAIPVEDGVVAMVSPQNGEEDFFRENLLVTADDQFADLTLERYVEALAAELRNRYPDTETLESGDITIAGLDGRWMVDKFTGPKGEARVYRVVLVKGPAAYVIHGTAPVWTFERYRPVFEAVAGSAEWVEPGTVNVSEPGSEPRTGQGAAPPETSPEASQP